MPRTQMSSTELTALVAAKGAEGELLGLTQVMTNSFSNYSSALTLTITMIYHLMIDDRLRHSSVC
jgi:hypothetical protein